MPPPRDRARGATATSSLRRAAETKRRSDEGFAERTARTVAKRSEAPPTQPPPPPGPPPPLTDDEETPTAAALPATSPAVPLTIEVTLDDPYFFGFTLHNRSLSVRRCAAGAAPALAGVVPERDAVAAVDARPVATAAEFRDLLPLRPGAVITFARAAADMAKRKPTPPRTRNEPPPAAPVSHEKPPRRRATEDDVGPGGEAASVVERLDSHVRSRMRAYLETHKLGRKELFKRLDLDSSGTLDRAEVEAALETLGLSTVACAFVMRQLDTDKSGDVDYREFSDYIKRKTDVASTETVFGHRRRRAAATTGSAAKLRRAAQRLDASTRGGAGGEDEGVDDFIVSQLARFRSAGTTVLATSKVNAQRKRQLRRRARRSATTTYRHGGNDDERGGAGSSSASSCDEREAGEDGEGDDATAHARRLDVEDARAALEASPIDLSLLCKDDDPNASHKTLASRLWELIQYNDHNALRAFLVAHGERIDPEHDDCLRDCEVPCAAPYPSSSPARLTESAAQHLVSGTNAHAFTAPLGPLGYALLEHLDGAALACFEWYARLGNLTSEAVEWWHYSGGARDSSTTQWRPSWYRIVPEWRRREADNPSGHRRRGLSLSAYLATDNWRQADVFTRILLLGGHFDARRMRDYGWDVDQTPRGRSKTPLWVVVHEVDFPVTARWLLEQGDGGNKGSQDGGSGHRAASDTNICGIASAADGAWAARSQASLRYLLFNAGPATADPHRLGFEDRSVLSNIALRASTPEQDLDETDAKDVLHARGIMLRLLRNVHPFAPVPDRRESPLSAADDMLPPQLVRLARTDPDAFARVLLPSGLIQNHFRATDRPKNIANAPLVAVLARHGCSAAVDALLDGFCRHAETECGVTTQHFEYGHGSGLAPLRYLPNSMHDDDANAAGMNLSGSRNRLTRWIFDEEDSTQDNRQQTAFAVTRPAAAPVATSTTLGDNHADRASRRRCWVLVDTSPWGAEDDHSGGGGGGGARTEEFRNARLRMRRAGAEGQWRSYGSRSKCVFTETGAAAVLASGAAAPRRAAPGWQDGAAESRRRGTVGFELNAVVQAHKQTAPPFATDSVPLSKGDGFGLRVSGQQLMLEQSESGEWWDVHRRWRLRGGRPPRSEVSGDPAATHVVVVLELRGTRLYSLDDDRLGGAWDWALVELQPPAGERVEVRLDGPAYGRRAASVAHLGNLVGRTLVFQKTRMRSDELAEGGDGEGDGTKKNGSANTTDICLSVGDAHHHKGTMRFGNGTARVLPVSALFRDQIVRVLSSGKPEVVNHRAIRALTNELWDKFALRYYVLQMVLYLLLVVAYTAALLHPDTVGLTLVCMLVAGVNSAFEISQLLAVGAVEYLLSSGNFFDNLVLVVVQLTLMGNMAYALSGTAQDRWWMALCAIVNLLTWVKLCLFWGAFELTGPYLRMITAMVRKMGEFLVVCTYFIVAFAAVFRIAAPSSPAFEDYASSMASLFRLGMSGDFDYEDISEHGVALFFLYAAYMLLVLVLMLNILIAMMSTSYEDVMHHVKADLQIDRARAVAAVLENTTLSGAASRTALEAILVQGITVVSSDAPSPQNDAKVFFRGVLRRIFSPYN